MTNRKLQAEIDRVLKRVVEGIEEFDVIWQKVQTAPTPNLKEKYEGDLKKEIKKLQRYRDQIKSWASSPDVKNKKPLLDARKQIEAEMERFKVLEKQTKTKAYSKEGLQQVLKKKKDPKKDVRYATLKWLDDMKASLKKQIGDFDSKMEAARSKGAKKKGADPDEIQALIDRHNTHIEKLAKVRKRLEKNLISINQVNEVKEGVEFFVNSNAEPDFVEDEGWDQPLEEDRDPEEVVAENNANHKVEGGDGEDGDDGDDDDAVDDDDDEPADDDDDDASSQKSDDTPAKAAPKPKDPKPKPDAKDAKEAKAADEKAKAAKAAAPKPSPAGAPGAAPAAAATPTSGKPATAAAAAAAGAAKGKTPASPAAGPASAKGKQPEPVAGAPGGPAAAVKSPGTTAAAAVVAANAAKGRGTAAAPTPVAAAKPGTPASPAAKEPLTMAAIVSKGNKAAAEQEAKRAAAAAAAAQAQAQAAQTPTAGTPTASQAGASSAAQRSPGAGPTPAAVNSNGHTATAGVALPQHLSQQQSASSQPVSAGTPRTPKPGPDAAAAVTAPPAVQRQTSSNAAAQPQQLPQQSDAAKADAEKKRKAKADAEAAAAKPKGSAVAGPNRSGAPTPPPQSNTPQPQPGSSSAAQAAGQPASAAGAGAAAPAAPASAAFGGGKNVRAIEENRYNLSMLEPSLRHMPDPTDSERPKNYVARNPYRTPPYFPGAPAPIFDDPAIFEKFQADLLFFIFYFQQGTPHQYLAARELKKQSWRYHKQFLTWFQRHDDPKHTTDEYEQGTYVYFDYETTWCQRIKNDFTFEYRHLEDELSVPTSPSI